MDSSEPKIEAGVSFRSPKKFLGNLDPSATARVIASAADIALIIDDGIVKDIALGVDTLARDVDEGAWRGRPWIETVTVESKSKIEALLQPSATGKPQWRQVNHPSAAGPDVPIRYTTVQTGEKGRIVALGRDLRTISALQQRLVEAHQDLERDYTRLREVETRYRILFDSVSDAVMVVDAATLEVEEANQHAEAFFGAEGRSVIGKSLRDLVTAKDRKPLDRLVVDALSAGTATLEKVRFGKNGGNVASLAASAFRQDSVTRLVLQLGASDGKRRSEDAGRRTVLETLELLPDGLVVTNGDLEIVAANPAFAQMIQSVNSGQLVGRQLATYIGRTGTDFNVLISNLKNHGFIRNFSTVVRDRLGAEEMVEISAVTAPNVDDGDDGCLYGFSIRSVARRLRVGARLNEELPSSVDQLTGLVGRMPLKDIVRESTDLIEKLCIDAALEITGDNRASAAEMLGLSRQGLYSKIKRFGLDD